jgi:hypothetical protein
MNLDPVRAKAYIIGQNKKHLEAAEKYAEACTEYGKIFNEYQLLIAKRIMVYKERKKNLGVEMAVIFALADNEWPERDKFIEINTRMNELEYLRRGMEQLLKAYESEKISIQSLMKYDAQGERAYTG